VLVITFIEQRGLPDREKKKKSLGGRKGKGVDDPGKEKEKERKGRPVVNRKERRKQRTGVR